MYHVTWTLATLGGDADGDELIGGRVKNDNDDAEWADVGVNGPDMRWDGIATAMWEQFVNEHITQGLVVPGM